MRPGGRGSREARAVLIRPSQGRHTLHCDRCHHADMAHAPSETSASLMKLGACAIPGCTCPEYREAIRRIDEELV